MEKIAELERWDARAPDGVAEDQGLPPEFVSKPSDLTLAENSLAHFEAQLKPVNDPSMNVRPSYNDPHIACSYVHQCI